MGFCVILSLSVQIGLTHDITLCNLHTMAADIRGLVDKALNSRDTDLATFVEKGQVDGKSIKQITEDLNLVTGIPITWRTLYRWIEKMEERAS